MTRLYSLAGMLAALLLSNGLDRVWEFLRVQNARTFNITPSLWFSGALDLVFAAAILALGWYMLFRAPHSRFVSVVFVVVGMCLLLSYPLRTLATSILRGSPWTALIQSIAVAPTSYTYHTAAFITVTGLAGYIRAFRFSAPPVSQPPSAA